MDELTINEYEQFVMIILDSAKKIEKKNSKDYSLHDFIKLFPYGFRTEELCRRITHLNNRVISKMKLIQKIKKENSSVCLCSFKKILYQ